MSDIIQTFTENDCVEGEYYEVKNVFIKAGAHIYKGKKICDLISVNNHSVSIKAKVGGIASKISLKSGDKVNVGSVLLEIKECLHPTLLGDICCDCGVVLEGRRAQEMMSEATKEDSRVAMLHSVPNLRVSKQEALRLGSEDIKSLLERRKLVLLVDLDQTLIHTTNDNIPPKLKDVFHFQLAIRGPWYHTRLRPFTRQFLASVSRCFELHICTFGVRRYAHCIAQFLDPKHTLFGDRILSRDECLDPLSKHTNLSSLFPCGDNLVCIMDDRSDVWQWAPNVVRVTPYHFFRHTGDIHAPPGLRKDEEEDAKTGFDFSDLGLSLNFNDKKNEGKEEKKEDGIKEKAEIKENKADEKTQNINKETENEENKDNFDEFKDKEKCKQEEKDKEKPKKQIEENETETKEDKEDVDNEIEQTKENKQDSDSEMKDQIEENARERKENKKDADSEREGTKEDKKDADNERQETKANKKDVDGEGEETKENRQHVDKESEETKENKEDPDNDGEKTKENKANVDSETKENKEDADKESGETKENKEDVDSEAEETKEEDGVIDVPDDDDYLLHLEDILVRLHSRFFTKLDEMRAADKGSTDNDSNGIGVEILPDLKRIVPEERAAVLRGTRLAFSGVVPRCVPLRAASACHIARGLGAKIDERVGQKTTHLVAAAKHTQKVRLAVEKFPDVKIVTPNWLWSCAERWERVDERLFGLVDNETEVTIIRRPPIHCLQKPAEERYFPAVSSSSSDTSLQSDQDQDPLMEGVSPLAFLSDAEAASMAAEVDDEMEGEGDDEGEDGDDGETGEEQNDKRKLKGGDFEDSDLELSQDRPKKKRRRNSDNESDSDNATDNNNDNNDNNDNESRATLSSDEELPSERFRRGEELRSDEDDNEGEEEDDMTAFGEELAQQLMRQ